MAKPKGTLLFKLVGRKSGSDHGGVRIESCDGLVCLSSLAGSKLAYTNVTVALVFYYYK